VSPTKIPPHDGRQGAHSLMALMAAVTQDCLELRLRGFFSNFSIFLQFKLASELQNCNALVFASKLWLPQQSRETILCLVFWSKLR
jgi:hypothetical protein